MLSVDALALIGSVRIRMSGPLKWFAVYENEPQAEVDVSTTDDRALDLALFHRAAAAGELFGRKVRGMWLLDSDAERGDIIAVCGLIPEHVDSRVTDRTIRCHRGT